MQLAVTAKRARTRSALTMAIGQLLLLIVLAYGVSYLVLACINFAPGPVDDEPRASALVPDSGSHLQAQLVCESTPPRVWEHSACDLPK
ncbi:MAG TPA: hypothetical protein VGI32_07100 [Steroidobacteraceae bacterium]